MSRPTRVLLVTHSLSGGGAERFVANLATRLDRDRFAPEVCSVTDRLSYPVPADVPVRVLGYGGPQDLPRLVLALRAVIRDRRPEVVLSNVLSTNALAGAALLGMPDRPRWIARIGNAPALGDPPWQRLWTRGVYRLADVAVANSRALAAAVEAAYPALRGRCRSLPNPTDFAALDRLAAEPGSPARPPALAGEARPILVWVGRLVPQKRPDLLLEAFARVRRNHDAQLWICGDGPLEAEVRAGIAALGLGSAVTLLGFQANPFAVLRQADLFLLTSDFEGLPNALIEAQGLGLPAIATRCPFGPDEIVEDGVTGRLVPPGDAEAMAQAIDELLADPALRQRMGPAARQLARERFGLERVMPRWEEVIEEVGTRSRL